MGAAMPPALGVVSLVAAHNRKHDPWGRLALTVSVAGTAAEMGRRAGPSGIQGPLSGGYRRVNPGPGSLARPIFV